MQHSLSRLAAALVAALAASAHFPAQRLAAQQDLVFQAETALMEVEVRVTDRRGRPVADLNKEDFELLENGKPQLISTFEFVRPPGPRGADQVGTPAGPVPLGGKATGEEPAPQKMERSTFVYLATRGRRENRRRIHDAVRKFLDENLAPGLLVSLEGSPFTSSRTELLQLLDATLAGGPGGSGGPGLVDTLAVDLARDDIGYSAAFEDLLQEANEEFVAEAEEIADRSALYNRIRMLEYIDLIRALGAFPGRKVVILFATGLPVDEDNIDIMEMLEDEATRARVRFYVSDVGGLAATPPGGTVENPTKLAPLFGDPLNNAFTAQSERRQSNQDGLYDLARATGGRAVLNSNSFDEIFDLFLEENSGYYLLGYYPRDTEQQGRVRRIKVTVDRPRTRVRHQRRYYEERPFEKMSDSERNLALYQALNFDTPYADLPLRADFEYFRTSDGRPTIVYAVGLHASDLPSAPDRRGQTVKLTVVAQAKALGATGRRAAPLIDERRITMTVADTEFDRLSSDPDSWMHYSSQMRLDPGEYDWKVVVRDDYTGALGSYQTKLRVPQPADKVSASSLLLTSRIEDLSSARPSKQPKRGAEDVLRVDGNRFYAAAVKSFRRGAGVFLLYDIYSPAEGPDVGAVTPKLALYRGREAVRPIPVKGYQAVPQPAAGRVRHLTALDTAGLPAGTYLVAAMVSSDPANQSAIYRRFELVEAGGETGAATGN